MCYSLGLLAAKEAGRLDITASVRGSLISHHAHRYSSRVRCLPVLEEEDALPRSERQAAVDHGDDLRGPCQHHAQMAWHVVRPFIRVHKVGRVFRHKMIEE